jgi:AcrR family transcriptional regulator
VYGVNVPDVDPARTVRLLWGVPPPTGRRGPRPGLELPAVVDAAVALADAEGLDAVTVRRLAADLGVAPMTLYGYVPGRADLLDLMVDRVQLAMARPAWGRTSWRTRVRRVAEANRDLLRAHPWVARLPSTRPALGPGLVAKYEHELGAFAGAGLDDLTTDAALTFVLGVVRSLALAEQDAAAARTATGLDERQWWDAAGPVLAQVLDPAAYPLASRVGTAAGAAQGAAYDPDRAWSFALERVLVSLDDLVAGARRV